MRHRQGVRKRRCVFAKINFMLNFMKTVTMVQFRRNAGGVLRRVAKGERFVLSHRGKPAARLEPLRPSGAEGGLDDPFLGVARRVRPSPQGKTKHEDFDRILYGRG
jgi:prevent-host-death family protein